MDSFIDPTPKRPVDAVKFLSFLDLSPISALLKTFYRHPAKIKHPPQAMLKLYAFYKLKRFRYLTELWKQLTKKTLRLLGFKHRLSYKTLWHWLNKRVKPEGLETVYAELMKQVDQALAAQGIEMAKEVVVDATVMQASAGDQEASYNGHYGMNCYLIHHVVCARTGLTLNWLVEPSNIDEGKLMVPLLAKAVADGFQPKAVFSDNGYAGYWNYEILNLLGIETFIGFRENAKPGWRGNAQTLKLRLRKMIKAGELSVEKLAELGIDADPEKNSVEGILCALAVAGQHEYVGDYFRNMSLATFQSDNEGWMRRYGPPRSVIEGTHGHQKDWLELDGFGDKGLFKARLHVALCMLCEAAVALVRVQRGVTSGLRSHAYLR
jgi:hypothetical protein